MTRRSRREVNWHAYGRLFVEAEFVCKHTGRCEMDPDFMDRLFELRRAYATPMVILSGYRHPSHPVEMRKARPGAHTFGRAADVLVSHADSVRLFTLAVEHGFTGFGVAQKAGSTRFLHLDDMEPDVTRPRPTLWSY
jgi:zinc D-Ala-D-Ala carboxypeptidase